MPFVLLFALPFACCGLILGSLLARPDLSARWVYSADLFGSALGALVVIPAISWVGVVETVAAEASKIVEPLKGLLEAAAKITKPK
jgi:hypothetical protein